jgi:hypothetical protein
MKYDDVSWHAEGDFPADLPPSAGATHIGMFVSWAILNGLAGAIHTEEFPKTLDSLRRRAVTPGELLLQACDQKFTDEDLSEAGNAFAEGYYPSSDTRPNYLADYIATLFQGEPSLYHVADTWNNYDRLEPILQERFKEWQAKV